MTLKLITVSYDIYYEIGTMILKTLERLIGFKELWF